MAEVFLARRRASGGVEKRMVIKRIRRERARDSRFAAMFVREARLSMSLAHKNIVPVFDFGRAGDELFLVMEYVDGVDLASALARASERGAPPAPVLVGYIGLEACQALEYAHQAAGHEGAQGVIHRDVTPANVLLSYSGEVKLLDFGIATSESGLGEPGAVRGTPPYMAPEQARGEALSARTDVFALGLVLWEALALRRAYAGVDAREVIAAAGRGEVPPLDAERVPAELRAIVERATRPDPADRFADARAMQLALDEYLVEARAGVERRGPVHQLLADWLRGLVPEREPVNPSGELAVPDGPVATFLDDGEERVTALFPVPPGDSSTARSMAATMPDPGEAAEDRTAGERAARWRSRRVAVAAVAAVLVAVPAIALLARNLASPGSPPARAAAVADRAAGVVAAGADVADRAGASAAPDGPEMRAPTAAPSGDFSAPRSETRGDPGSGADGAGGEATERHAPRGDASAAHTAPPSPHGGAGPGGRGAGAAKGEGTVRVSSSPWAEVRVAGRSERCHETPCVLRLPAGRYTLSLRNPVAHLVKSVAVEVRPSETVTLRETLTAPR